MHRDALQFTPMTDSNTNQEQAAQAVLQAAGELGYASDLGFITNTFNSCGYDVSLGNQIVVSIETVPSQPNVGETTTFNANISNGEGPYSFSWDVNGDGETDGTAQSLTTKYSNIYSGDISVEVSGSNNSFGQTSKNVTIAGADIQLQQVVNISENLSQVCGNNDNVIDPGERWTALIDAKNVGQKTASNAYLALGKNRSSVSGSVGDNYGNQTVSCERQFIDISNTGTVKPWVTAGTQYPADDEGYVSLSLNQAFSHYGQNISSMVASSNGYFNTNTSAKGDDWNNDCPLPVVPDRDMVGARIAPMHADLNSSVFYQQFFNTCPRQAESGGNLACEVFMWQGADLWETTNIIESVDFQAILYPATSQWVFQYDGTGFDGSSSTTGMQNASATDGLTYACNTANSINTSTAVCTYNKNHLPSSNGFDFVKLETPIISLGNLSTNQSKTESLQFSIATNATCGTEFAINHEASVYDKGFNAGQNTILSGTIGQNGQCNVVSNCAIPTESNFIQPNNGLWWNPERSGNGVDLHTFNGSSLLYVMYTGKPDRSPIWYIANDADSFYNQYYNNILMVSFPGGYAANNQQVDTVGWSNTTFIDEKHAIQVRNIHGELSAEKIQMDQFDTDLTPNMHTGHYFAPSQSGWGQSVVTLGNTQVVITYIYDQQGNPFWTIASGTNDTNQKSVVTADSFCPHCPSLPMDVFTVGTMRMTFNGQSSGTINNYNISFPPNVTWNKTNLPIENLVPDED